MASAPTSPERQGPASPAVSPPASPTQWLEDQPGSPTVRLGRSERTTDHSCRTTSPTTAPLSPTSPGGSLPQRGRSHSPAGGGGAVGRLRKKDLLASHPNTDFVAQHYDFTKEIGRGSFGKVNLVRERSSGEMRVCKVIDTSKMNREVLLMMKREMLLLRNLDHPNIVKLYEYCQDVDKNEIVLILEYLDGGDGLNLLRTSGGILAEALVARLMRQVLLALSYCHAQGILHRDVKPENMMLLGSWPDERLDCKLIDFGFATEDLQKKEFLGTPTYMAPETVRRSGGYGPETDMWSVGVTAMELLAGLNPFSPPPERYGDKNWVFDKLKKYLSFRQLAPKLDEFGPGWGDRSDEGVLFLKLLLQNEPRARPSAAQALDHRWIRQNKSAGDHITFDMVQSWASYAVAPPLARYCLYIIAARMEIPDLQSYGTVFLNVDKDNNGFISKKELAEALEGARGVLWAPQVGVDTLFDSADLGFNGELSFTDFVASCLCTRLPSMEDLICRAFGALDTNCDGLVNKDDIRAIFADCEFPLIHRLPENRDFDLQEWCKIFTGRRPSTIVLEKKSLKEPEKGVWERIVDSFSCSAGACSKAKAPNYVIAPTHRHMASRRPTWQLEKVLQAKLETSQATTCSTKPGSSGILSPLSPLDEAMAAPPGYMERGISAPGVLERGLSAPGSPA